VGKGVNEKGKIHVGEREKAGLGPAMNVVHWPSVTISRRRLVSSSASRSRYFTGRRSPCRRNIGGTPMARWISEHPWAQPSCKKASRRAIVRSFRRPGQRESRGGYPYSETGRQVAWPSP